MNHVGTDLDGFHAAFGLMRERQARLQDREQTAFDAKVDALLWRVSELALGDSRGDHPKLRVASAPTGSGKTMASLALVAAGLAADPGFTAGIVVEYIEAADQVYRHLLALLPEELHGEVAVWTSAHDTAGKGRKTKDEHGFIPQRRFPRAALDTARIAIGTHKRFLAAVERGRADGLTHHQGNRRSIVFVDETPTLVKVVEMAPSAVYDFRDAVHQADEEHAWVPVLHRIAARMDEAYLSTRRGGRFIAVELVESEAEATIFGSECAATLKRFIPESTPGRHTKAEAFEDIIRFIRAARDGYAFLYAHDRPRFVAYKLTFRPFPGLVILDATSDFTGAHLLASGMERVEAPRVDYRNLILHRVPIPKALAGSTRELMKRAATRREYTAWVTDTILQNTHEGEVVLIVAHKALVDNEDVPAARSLEQAWDLAGRKVLVMTWGSSVGANWAREAEVVFLFGEFHIPKASVVGTVLGLRDQPFRQAKDIGHALAGEMQGDYGQAADDHLCRWSAQLAARGKMREIDGDGIASPMRLYATMPRGRLFRLRSEVWHGARPPVLLGGGQQGITKDEALAHLLANPEAELVWYSELAKHLDVTTENLLRLLRHPRATEVVSAYGWSEVTRKAVGLPGKGKGLARTAVSSQAAA